MLVKLDDSLRIAEHVPVSPEVTIGGASRPACLDLCCPCAVTAWWVEILSWLALQFLLLSIG